MARKGDRRTAASDVSAADLAEALAPLGNVTSRPMFGGHGVFADGVMFGLVDGDGTPFLRADRADASAIAGLEAAGAERHGSMPYWSIPAPTLLDHASLLARARDALAVARAAR